MNTIWFDMDGTIYNFYDIPNWLEMLEKGRYGVYNVLGYRRRHLTRIMEVVAALVKQGWRVGVLTWASKNLAADDVRIDEISDVKYAWLSENAQALKDNGYFFCFEYGKNKAEYLAEQGLASEDGFNFLVDDNALVRADWEAFGENFKTIDASVDYVATLEGLLG